MEKKTPRSADLHSADLHSVDLHSVDLFSAAPIELPSDILGTLEDLTLDNLLIAEMLGYIALNPEMLISEATVINADSVH